MSSAPPYDFGGTAAHKGDTWAIRRQFELITDFILELISIEAFQFIDINRECYIISITSA
jgi:hypothetical protein